PSDPVGLRGCCKNRANRNGPPIRAIVGWVERSETHHVSTAKMMGFASALPILRIHNAQFAAMKIESPNPVRWCSAWSTPISDQNQGCSWLTPKCEVTK